METLAIEDLATWFLVVAAYELEQLGYTREVSLYEWLTSKNEEEMRDIIHHILDSFSTDSEAETV